MSNNNSAVFNVRDKLSNYGYNLIVASLGNNENKASFFGNLGEQTVNQDFEISKERIKKAKDEVRDLDSVITASFQNRNKLAVLRADLSDAKIEFSHVKSKQPLDQEIYAILDKKFRCKWDSIKTLKLKRLLPVIYSKRRPSIAQTIRLIIKYRLFDLTIISKYGEELSIYVNHKFYELYIANLKNEISGVENWLASNNEETNLKRFIEMSKAVFNDALFKKYSHLEKITFTIENYRKSFDAFIKRYPVILSSTLSLHTSIPKGYLFDYLIIDEASQVDVIKSAVCFSCCRNAIVVGDSMQLSHIVDKQSGKAAEKVRDEHSIPPMYDYARKNILDSLKILYRNTIESVLLKEHYRCHPLIIGFCNKKYYHNKLVIMTSADNHPFRIIETRVHGEIGNSNQKQIHETNNYIRQEYSDYTKVGVVAPYRDHANKLQKELPHGVEADTIHKFQGREKDVIIFNTVKAEIEPFMDNSNLINVAVSRSVKEFIIVKPASMQTPHGTNIGDLIRYMYYTTDPKRTLVPGRISSVFDLLYKEFSHIRIPLLSFSKNINGSPAEVIIHKLLQENYIIRQSSIFIY